MFEVRPTDPAIIGVVIATLAVTGLGVCRAGAASDEVGSNTESEDGVSVLSAGPLRNRLSRAPDKGVATE
jgi:hypothetical protein